MNYIQQRLHALPFCFNDIDDTAHCHQINVVALSLQVLLLAHLKNVLSQPFLFMTYIYIYIMYMNNGSQAFFVAFGIIIRKNYIPQISHHILLWTAPSMDEMDS